jgi:hypothetical protein
MPILNATINVQDRFIVPGWVAGFGGEELPVALVAARPRHPVHAGAAAQDLPHRQVNGSAMEVQVWLGREAPIPLVPKAHWPFACFHDCRYLIAAARFQQQYTDLPVLGQSARHHRTGSPRAADDEVVL